MTAAATVTAMSRVPQRWGHYERQRRFVEWITELYIRADTQGISLESLTDFELEWIGRM